MKTYFPTYNAATMNETSDFEPRIKEEFNKMGLEPTKSQLRTACGLKEVMEMRHSLMCQGGPLSGKSTAIQAVANVLGNVDIAKINTKEVTNQQFYGDFNQDGEWKDGIFSKQLRAFSEVEDGRRKWIVLDGPIDPEFVEHLNSVMDDNKALCLANGALIPLKSHFNLIFETESLATTTPATISRNGFVSFPASNIQWTDLYSHFASKFSEAEKKDLEQAQASLEKVFAFMSTTKTVLPLN